MTELILGAIILALLGYHAWYVRESKKEISELLSRLASKNYQEYVEIKKVEEKKPELFRNDKNPDFIPYEEYMSVPENFDKMIKEQLKGTN